MLADIQSQIRGINVQLDSIIKDFSQVEEKNKSLFSIPTWRLDVIQPFKKSYRFANSKYGGKLNNVDSFFKMFLSGELGSYGVYQGVFTSMPKKNNKFYKEMLKRLKEKYNFTTPEAIKLLANMESSGGICSYATIVESIFYYYRNNQKAFKERYGIDYYSMHNGSNGKPRLNMETLLLDLFVKSNMHVDGVFTVDKFGKVHFNKNAEKITFGDMYYGNVNTYFLLEDNFITGGFPIYNGLGRVVSNEKMKKIVDDVASCLSAGEESVVLNFEVNGKPMQTTSIRMLNTSTNTMGVCPESHAVIITGIDKNGFIVSSWGDRFIIPFSDLQNSGRFSVATIDVEALW